VSRTFAADARSGTDRNRIGRYMARSTTTKRRCVRPARQQPAADFSDRPVRSRHRAGRQQGTGAGLKDEQ